MKRSKRNVQTRYIESASLNMSSSEPHTDACVQVEKVRIGARSLLRLRAFILPDAMRIPHPDILEPANVGFVNLPDFNRAGR